ncbi:MAG: hypothetical protein SGILL_002077 [Bacillariaceae sp.]
MSRWQDEDVSQQSSSEGSVEIEMDDDMKESSRRQRQTASLNKEDDEERSAESEPYKDGVPRRWIMDRIHGTVHGSATGKAPRPPCSLCWPPPIVGACPCLFEENFLCTTVGRVGFCSGGKKQQSSGGRRVVMTSALLLNLAGLLVTVFAALALTDSNQELVKLASFNSANLNPMIIEETATFPPVNLHLGLQALSVQDGTVVAYKGFCTAPGMEQFLPPQDCNACHETSLYVIIGLVVAMAAYLPTLFTDCLRIYQDYDVNCQKTTAFVWSLVSLAGYGLVYYYYTYVCLASFYQGSILYDNDGNVVEENASGGEAVVVVDFAWKMGTGQMCILAGFGLKAIDFLCNCCVATPIISRDREEQWKYERLSEQAELGVYTSEKESNAKEDSHHNVRDESSGSEESSSG